MKCAILQPSYIPWRGYFHQIQKADVFVFYDDVQHDKHGWRNRNRIKTAQGTRWLTIPVQTKGCVVEGTPINQIRIAPEGRWAAKHWLTLKQSYARTPCFASYAEELERCYLRPSDLLADFTIDLTVALARLLGIQQTRFVRSSALDATGTKTDRL